MTSRRKPSSPDSPPPPPQCFFHALHWVKRGKNIRKRGDWCPGLRAVQILLSPEILGWLQEELIQQEYPRDPGRMERLGSCVLCLKRLLPSLAIFNDSPPSWWSLVFSWKTHGCVSYLEPKGKTKWPNRNGIFHFPSKFTRIFTYYM